MNDQHILHSTSETFNLFISSTFNNTNGYNADLQKRVSVVMEAKKKDAKGNLIPSL